MTNDFISRYLQSLYFVVVTMTTVGYGDVSPTNKYEMVFTICFQLIAQFIFGYTINKVGTIFAEMQKNKNFYQRKIGIMNRFMNKHKALPFNLKMKIRRYLKYLYYFEKVQNDNEENAAINELSNDLKEKLYLHTNGEIIKKIKCLSQNFTDNFLKNLIPYVEKQRFAPGEKIYKEGQVDDFALYYLQKGSIELCSYVYSPDIDGPPEKKVLARLTNKEPFGFLSLFTSEIRKESAISVDYSTVYKIKQDKFLSLIRNFDNDYQTYCYIRDQAILYKNTDNLYNYCYICQQKNENYFANLTNKRHDSQNCPTIHYIPSNKIKCTWWQIKSNNEFQQRQKFHRKRKKYLKAIIYKQILYNYKKKRAHDQDEITESTLPYKERINEKKRSGRYSMCVNSIERSESKHLSNVSISNNYLMNPNSRAQSRKSSQKFLAKWRQGVQKVQKFNRVLKFFEKKESIKEEQKSDSIEKNNLNVVPTINVSQDPTDDHSKIRNTILQEIQRKWQSEEQEKQLKENNIFKSVNNINKILNDQQLLTKQAFFFNYFEKAKKFKAYYPLGNINNAIDKYKLKLIKFLFEKHKYNNNSFDLNYTNFVKILFLTWKRYSKKSKLQQKAMRQQSTIFFQKETTNQRRNNNFKSFKTSFFNKSKSCFNSIKKFIARCCKQCCCCCCLSYWLGYQTVTTYPAENFAESVYQKR